VSTEYCERNLVASGPAVGIR